MIAQESITATCDMHEHVLFLCCVTESFTGSRCKKKIYFQLVLSECNVSEVQASGMVRHLCTRNVVFEVTLAIAGVQRLSVHEYSLPK
jgi:hypothetical protein